MVKIVELLDDLQLNQRIEGKKPHYIQLCTFRLNRWKDFMKDEFNANTLNAIFMSLGREIKRFDDFQDVKKRNGIVNNL